MPPRRCPRGVLARRRNQPSRVPIVARRLRGARPRVLEVEELRSSQGGLGEVQRDFGRFAGRPAVCGQPEVLPMLRVREHRASLSKLIWNRSPAKGGTAAMSGEEVPARREFPWETSNGQNDHDDSPARPSCWLEVRAQSRSVDDVLLVTRVAPARGLRDASLMTSPIRRRRSQVRRRHRVRRAAHPVHARAVDRAEATWSRRPVRAILYREPRSNPRLIVFAPLHGASFRARSSSRSCTMAKRM